MKLLIVLFPIALFIGVFISCEQPYINYEQYSIPNDEDEDEDDVSYFDTEEICLLYSDLQGCLEKNTTLTYGGCLDVYNSDLKNVNDWPTNLELADLNISSNKVNKIDTNLDDCGDSDANFGSCVYSFAKAKVRIFDCE